MSLTRKKQKKKRKKTPANFQKRFSIFFFVQNRLPPFPNTPTKFKPNPSSHLGVVSALSPDRHRQTDRICSELQVFSFAYLQIQATLEFG
jgi:hypothetical protein